MIRLFSALLFSLFFTSQGAAQQAVWIQVEAQPSLSKAQQRVEAYSNKLEDVAGFYVGNGWYGIAIGPYAPVDADALLRQLRRDRTIPSDSFIATGRSFRQQFWPVGISAPTTAQALPGATPTTTDEPDTAEVEVEIVPIEVPDETKRQARASEALLDRDQRKDLQIALQWAGFYSGAIDGAYGRGTRGSMSAWQEAKNHEVTGVLTTKQRIQLLDDYNSVLDGMDLELVRDNATGIQMLIPTGVVEFMEYEPPFARFAATGDVDAQVFLISQSGDQDRLFGLYEILQTLEITPKEGPRNRNDSSFQIEGIGDGIHTFTTVGLSGGEIKGFTLVWPEGDDERRRRVLDEMRKSYETVEGVLNPALSQPGEDQAIDLVAGLAVRKPQFSRSGFFIDDAGTVLTTSEAIGDCSPLTINTEHNAEVVHIDESLGIAVLRPETTLAPMAIVSFQTSIPRLQSDIAVAGFPYGGVLTAPSLTFGKLADIRGLNGEEDVKRLALTAQLGDAGGPVFDNGGAVLGMLLPKTATNGQVLPPEVSFSVDSDLILASLETAGIAATTTDTVAFMPPETLTLRAADQTVLVSCW